MQLKLFTAYTLLLAAGEFADAFTAPLVVRAHGVARSASACMSAGNDQAMDRRDMITAFSAAGAGVLLCSQAVLAADQAAAPPQTTGPPTDWGLTKQYYPDASKMVKHMRYCTNMDKGEPNMADIALNCKKEMVEFVANYRRSSNINGKLSYSNLYTSISVLAGHYASYGPKFPVPEKRRKRLLQEYSDIERAIKRQR